MRHLLLTAVILSVASSCATPSTLPQPKGSLVGDGMYALTPLAGRKSARPSAEAWDANFYYPALPSRAAEIAPKNTVAEVPVTAVGPVAAAGYLFFSGYKATFSRLDGSTCRFSPSCSQFGLEATRRYGLGGMLMTFGRLQKDHSAEDHYVMSNPPYLDDPVSAYGFSRRSPKLDDFSAYDDAAQAWYQHLRAVRNLDY